MPTLVFAAVLAVACGTSHVSSAGGGSGSGGGGSDAGAPSGSGPVGSVDAGSGGGSVDAGGSGGGSGSGGSSGTDGGSSSGGGTGGGGTDGGTTVSGPKVLAPGENAHALSIDATNVYWLRYGQSAEVRWMPKSGGTPATLVRTASVAAQSLIATGNGILWEGSTCSPPCDYPGAGHEWGIFMAPAGVSAYGKIADIYGSGGLAADASAAYSRDFNTATGRWNLLSCGRDGSGCHQLVTDSPLSSPVYLDGGRLFWIDQPTDTDNGPRSNLNWEDPQSGTGHGSLVLHDVLYITGLRVNGPDFAVRAGFGRGDVWTGSTAGSGSVSMIWGSPNGADHDVDISQGRVYWNQRQTTQYPGCLGSANLDGTDGHCLDQGAYNYDAVRADDTHVYFIRDGDVLRLPR